MAARRILNGTPGTTWKNTTGKVRYQLIVNWVNSCGRCIALDHAISTSQWPLPFHPRCLCKSLPIYPGHSSEPFIDFREQIDALPAHRRANVIGKAALALVDNHVLRWPDVVNRDRIKPLHELVAKHSLTVERMTAAGVDRRTAQRAYDRAHGHDAEALAEAHRKAQAEAIAAKAEAQRQAKEAARRRLEEAEAKVKARPKKPTVPTSVERAAKVSAAHLAKVQTTTTTYLRRAKVKIETAHEAGLQARAEAELEVKFVAAEGASGRSYRTVVIDIGKVDADIARDRGFYVSPGGGGAAIAGRYEEFGRFYTEAKAKGVAIEMPRLAIGDAKGDISISDGRHRFAWLRDHGATAVPVRVPREDEAKVRRRYGFVPTTTEAEARRLREAETARPKAEAERARRERETVEAEAKRKAAEAAKVTSRGWPQGTDPDLEARQERLAKVGADQAKVLPALAAKVGMTPDAYRAHAERQLKGAIDAGEFYVRVDPAKVAPIVDSGRFKSLFEISKGFGHTPRLSAEAGLMGVPRDLEKSKRPIYGYVSTPDFRDATSAAENVLDSYGTAIVRLKPTIRERTTVTVGDSLIYSDRLVASPATDAGHIGTLPVTGGPFRATAKTLAETTDPLDHLAKLSEVHGYVEAQYHGGVGLDDIAEVGFWERPDAGTIAALEGAGIPWRLYGKK